MVLPLVTTEVVLPCVSLPTACNWTDEVHSTLFVGMRSLVSLQVFVVQERSAAAWLRADEVTVFVVAVMMVELGLQFELLAAATTGQAGRAGHIRASFGWSMPCRRRNARHEQPGIAASWRDWALRSGGRRHLDGVGVGLGGG